MLLFKKKFIEQIKRGEKTQTIRLWKHRQMKVGQRSYIPGIGYIIICDVAAIAIEELTDEDAKPDGFKTADALKKELVSIYAEKLSQGYTPFRIRFQVLRPEEQERIKREKMDKKLGKTVKNLHTKK